MSHVSALFSSTGYKGTCSAAFPAKENEDDIFKISCSGFQPNAVGFRPKVRPQMAVQPKTDLGNPVFP